MKKIVFEYLIFITLVLILVKKLSFLNIIFSFQNSQPKVHHNQKFNQLTMGTTLLWLNTKYLSKKIIFIHQKF